MEKSPRSPLHPLTLKNDCKVFLVVGRTSICRTVGVEVMSDE